MFKITSMCKCRIRRFFRRRTCLFRWKMYRKQVLRLRPTKKSDQKTHLDQSRFVTSSEGSFHVQQMHLPRIGLENPQPPLKDEKLKERDWLRRTLLLMLAEFLTGKRNIQGLVYWVNRWIRRKISRSEILSKAKEQMKNLCTTLVWKEPMRFTLVPIHSPCVLKHWRYQALLSQELVGDELIVYLSYGWLEFYG